MTSCVTTKAIYGDSELRTLAPGETFVATQHSVVISIQEYKRWGDLLREYRLRLEGQERKREAEGSTMDTALLSSSD